MAKLTAEELKIKIKELKVKDAGTLGLPLDEWHEEWHEVSFKEDLENGKGEIKYKDVVVHVNTEDEATSIVNELSQVLFDDQYLNW